MFNFLIIPISQNSKIFYWHKKNYFPITDSYIRTQLLYDIYLFCSKMNTFPNVIHRFLSKLNPFRFHSERREKIWFSHFFVVPQKEGLHKNFWGTTKKCENHNLSWFLF